MSRRELFVLLLLSAVCAAVATIVVVGGETRPAPHGRLFSEAPREPIDSIEWRGGGEALRVERSGTTYAVVSPISVPARAGALDSLVGALWTSRALRQVTLSAVPTPRDQVTVRWPGRTLGFELYRPREGDRFGYIVIGQRGYLVEGHAARDLWVELDEVRARRPFAAVARAERIEIIDAGEGTLSIEPSPWRVARGGSPAMLADPAKVQALFASLGDVVYREFREIPHGQVWSMVAVTDRDRTVSMGFGGECPGGGVFADGNLGKGCIEGLKTLRELALGGVERLVDNRLVPAGRSGDVTSVTVARGAAGRVIVKQEEDWTLDGKPLGSEVVARVLHDVDALQAGVPVSFPAEAGEPSLTLTLEIAGDEPLVLSFYRSNDRFFVRRDHEPVWWPVADYGVALRPLLLKK